MNIGWKESSVFWINGTTKSLIQFKWKYGKYICKKYSNFCQIRQRERNRHQNSFKIILLKIFSNIPSLQVLKSPWVWQHRSTAGLVLLLLLLIGLVVQRFPIVIGVLQQNGRNTLPLHYLRNKIKSINI